LLLFLWSAPGPWERIFILASRDPVIVFASVFFSRNLVRESNDLSNTQVFMKFVFGVIVLPDLINSLYTYHNTFVGGDLEKVALLWLSDFITIFSIAVPILHYFKP